LSLTINKHSVSGFDTLRISDRVIGFTFGFKRGCDVDAGFDIDDVDVDDACGTTATAAAERVSVTVIAGIVITAILSSELLLGSLTTVLFESRHMMYGMDQWDAGNTIVAIVVF
jgi:hypothetical protein